MSTKKSVSLSDDGERLPTASNSLDIPPRLQSVLEAWSDLPPHVQETISLLADLKSRRRSMEVRSDFRDRQRSNIEPELQRTRREILRGLRHVPEQFDLCMDCEGWVGLAGLIKSVERTITNIRDIGIVKLLAPLGDRVEVSGDRARATYGHSAKEFNPACPSIPEIPLFHGTGSRSWPLIELFGLQPMGRRFVQLTCDFEYAHEIASANCDKPIVLQVRTISASEEGVQFFETGTHVWMATHIPSVCLQIWGDSNTADTLGLFDKESNDE